jgi:mannosyltransferase
VAGLVGGLQNAVTSRTQAGEVAAAITARAEPGDVVAYCPDQLGPAVNRLLPDWLHQITYPLGGSPQRVDWVDYAERNRTADPAVFARFADAVAGPRHTVWLVWREGYRTLGGGCERTVTALRLLRPGSTVVVTPGASGYETHYVTRSPGS